MQLLINPLPRNPTLKALCVILLLAFAGTANASDTLHLVNGSSMAVNLKKLQPFRVSYVHVTENNARPDKVLRHMSTSKISEIIYDNGRRDSVLPVRPRANQSGERFLTASGFNNLGASDAKLYFKGAKGPATGTFLATFPGSPLLGLMVAIPVSVTRPLPARFTYPNGALTSNSDYVDGYAKQAHRMKASKVWINWGAGTVMTFVTYFVFRSLIYR